MTSENPIFEMLKNTKSIAVVGLSNDETRDSFRVAQYLQRAGYKIIPVNPNISEVLGERSYKSLRDVNEPVDLVDVFRRSEFVAEIVNDAIAIKAKAIWLQFGIRDASAEQKARDAGLKVIVDKCTKIEHARISG